MDRQSGGTDSMVMQLGLSAVALACALASSPSDSFKGLAAADPAGSCECRHKPPAKNIQALTFCNWYRQRSCCLPAHDVDMQNKFLALIEAGPTCEKFQNKAKVFMSMAFCYGCDPDEPTHFTPPLNTQFFSAEKTVKICTEVSDNMAPAAFADCGFMLPDDRETICSPNSAVVPEYIWPDCLDGQYMCFINSTKTWNCSDGPCQPSDIPTGFTNVPCNITERTCEGVLMLLNDNRAAKPPNYEDYPVELIDRKLCMNTYQDDITCACLRIPSDFSSAQMLQARTWTSLPLILALSAWLERNG